jgi:hypothetical protein
MSEYDTFKAQIEVTYTRPRMQEPQEQALADNDMFYEEPSELFRMMRSAFEEDTVDIVIVHETSDAVTGEVAELEVAAIAQTFDVDEVDEEWG